MIKVGSIITRLPGHRLIKKVRIENLADCLCEKHSPSHPLLTPITREEQLRSITEQGYEVLFDPPVDGNCQFSMDAYPLRNLGIFRSTVTLGNDVINYLNTNDISPDGFLLELFAGILWCQYLNEMKRNGTYGEEITLRALANVFGIEIIVVSTLGQQGLVHIQPENSEPLSPVIFGNFAEGQGFHGDVLEDKST